MLLAQSSVSFSCRRRKRPRCRGLPCCAPAGRHAHSLEFVSGSADKHATEAASFEGFHLGVELLSVLAIQPVNPCSEANACNGDLCPVTSSAHAAALKPATDAIGDVVDDSNLAMRSALVPLTRIFRSRNSTFSSSTKYFSRYPVRSSARVPTVVGGLFAMAAGAALPLPVGEVGWLREHQQALIQPITPPTTKTKITNTAMRMRLVL